jgi:uncharacterized protein YuzE
MSAKFIPALKLSVDENTGNVRSAYLQIRQGRVDETREVSEGRAFADYDASGTLLGIELIGPCEVEILENIASQETEAVRRFLRSSPPRFLVPAAVGEAP